jgi:Holliday junction resolvase
MIGLTIKVVAIVLSVVMTGTLVITMMRNTSTRIQTMTNSKQKGKRGELELVKMLKKLFPGPNWRRSQQYCGMDDGEPDVVGVHSLHIECKRVESGTKTLYKWVDQAERDAENGQIPVVMHRASLQPWLVIVPLDRLKDLVIEVDTLIGKDIPESSTSSRD